MSDTEMMRQLMRQLMRLMESTIPDDEEEDAPTPEDAERHEVERKVRMGRLEVPPYLEYASTSGKGMFGTEINIHLTPVQQPNPAGIKQITLNIIVKDFDGNRHGSKIFEQILVWFLKDAPLVVANRHRNVDFQHDARKPHWPNCRAVIEGMLGPVLPKDELWRLETDRFEPVAALESLTDMLTPPLLPLAPLLHDQQGLDFLKRYAR